MTYDLKILAYRSLLGMYAATMIEDEQTKKDKDKWWYQNTYKIYKKCRGLKKVGLETIYVNLLKHKLEQIEKLEKKYFVDDTWNLYSLCIITLEYMVNELDYVDLKNLFLDIKPLNDLALIEQNNEYKELQKHCYRYFTDVIKIIEG